MTKTSLKAKYEPSAQAASATLSVGLGDLTLKASCSDRTLKDGYGLAGVSLGVEKPGLLIIDYDLPKQAARFQFMNSAKVFGKQVKLTYIHPQKANATVLESTVVLNSANKVTGKYSFQSGKGSVKYTYTNSSGATLEPAYDFNTDAWSYSASQTLGEGDTVKLTYETSKKVAGLEWTRDLKQAGSFKVACIIETKEGINPKVSLERTWNLDL